MASRVVALLALLGAASALDAGGAFPAAKEGVEDTQLAARTGSAPESSALDEQLGASSAWGRRRRRRRRRYIRRRRRNCNAGHWKNDGGDTCSACGTGRYMGSNNHGHT